MRVATVLDIVAILAVALASPVRAQLTNFSFEPTGAGFDYAQLGPGSSAIPGWITIDSGVEWFRPASFGDVPPAHGEYAVDLANGTHSAGGVRQTFATMPFEYYALTFWLGTSESSGRDGTCEVVASVDGQGGTFSAVNHAATTVYTLQVFTFIADDWSATLDLRCLQDANAHFAYVDAVELFTPLPARRSTWGAIKALYR